MMQFISLQGVLLLMTFLFQCITQSWLLFSEHLLLGGLICLWKDHWSLSTSKKNSYSVILNCPNYGNIKSMCNEINLSHCLLVCVAMNKGLSTRSHWGSNSELKSSSCMMGWMSWIFTVIALETMAPEVKGLSFP